MDDHLPSRIDKVHFRGRDIYVKRDDLIDTCLSGNKYRKLYTLLKTPSHQFHTIVSYGGAQSNAMYAIACLCHSKGWTFHYYTKNLPQYLKKGIEGNLELSLSKGMQLHEVSHEGYEQKIKALKSQDEEGTLLISQGGADRIAREGIALLAEEINAWKEKMGFRDLKVVLPSGTGTTALFLNEALDADVSVYTSVLVGDEAYQKEQWERLLPSGPYPSILSMDKKRKFAKPYDEYLQIHEELRESTGIVFDLIYAPKTWMEMGIFFTETKSPVLYIHTGGVSGNASMLERYKYKRENRR